MAMLFIVSLGIYSVKAQYLNIEKTDGSVLSEPIASVESIMFPANYLEMNLYQAPTESLHLSTINKITFELATGEAEYFQNSLSGMAIYPNPVNSYFVLKNLSEEPTTLKVYSMFGKLVLESEISKANPQVNVKHLAPGAYVVKINGETLKLIKQ